MISIFSPQNNTKMSANVKSLEYENVKCRFDDVERKMHTTSIGRFAVDREFVNIENSLDHFGPRWCPRSPRGAPRGPFLDQDDAQDRQEEPKGIILGPRWCPRSAQDGSQPHMGNS